MYKPPPISGHLEPSLGWKPVVEVKEKVQESPHQNMALEISKRDPKLHFSSIDPLAYHHLTPKERPTVQFEKAAQGSRNTSPSRPSTPTPNSPSRTQSPTFRERRNSDGETSPNRGCYNCGGSHFKRDCPKLLPMTNSGNERSPSPSRR
jgi:hypothetical protein